MDARSVPVVQRDGADFRGRRYRASVRVRTTDPATGETRDIMYYYRSDSPIDVNALRDSIRNDVEGDQVEKYDPRSGMAGGMPQDADIRVISVIRAF